MIVIDTLRADHVGSFGAKRPTTPELDRLADQGVRYERAYATAPWTAPSIASILTGLYPSTTRTESVDQYLAEDVVTVAERLRDHDYETAAVVSHLMLMGARGFGQGFEHYEMAIGGHDEISTEDVTRRGIARLETLAQSDAPYFLFLHYFDPHYTYLDHPEVDYAPASAGRLAGNEPIRELRTLNPPLRAVEIDFLERLYDEEVRHTDAGIGRVLAAMERLGLDRDTAVIVTADHGEEFMERGWLGHTRTLHEELIRVPLLIRAPGLEPHVVADPVSLVSIAPTLLELLGVASDPAAFERASLLRDATGAASEPLFAEVDFKPMFWAEKRAFQAAVIDGRFKLIRDRRTGRQRLYDLVADPLERSDILLAQKVEARRLVSLLETHLDRRKPLSITPRNQTLSPDDVARLEALGYVEPPEPSPDGSRPQEAP